MSTTMIRLLSGFSLSLTLPQLLFAGAVVFTNDTHIGSADTQYEGADIIITNCSVGLEGTHSFAHLNLQSGGSITHTRGPNGPTNNLEGSRYRQV